ncbi:MAG: DUF4128 domain-containing protein [Campylobacter sp.]|nr:DUF4128 domain-containing protein [Campylobacter sp.]
MLKIRQALEKAVLAVSPQIDTQFENTAFSPRAGLPYQQLFFLPSKSDTLTIDEAANLKSGVFQITLRYPAGGGVKDVFERIRAYEDVFKVGTKLRNGGTEVYINAPLSINILGIDGDRYSLALSIYFRSYQI